MWPNFTVKKSQTYIYTPIYLLLLTFALPIEYYYYFYNDTNIINNINSWFIYFAYLMSYLNFFAWK